MTGCSKYPNLTQFFHVAGAVESIRRSGTEQTHHPVDCPHCAGWHVLAIPPAPVFLVTISRSWSKFSVLRDELIRMRSAHPSWVLLHGNALKGDQAAAGIWTSMGGRARAMPADWSSCGEGCPGDMSCRRRRKGDKGTYCSEAGFRRNREMARTRPEKVLAFVKDKSSGATHCAEYAQELGLKVVWIRHNGATGEVTKEAA